MIRLLLLGLVLAGVWYLYRVVTQQGSASTAGELPQAQAPDPPGETGEPSPASSDAEEMIECPVCRAYLQASAVEGCGRPDCPIPALAAARAEEAHRDRTE